ncbi:hypothetical protein D3C73_1055540 [compost metagenome]
MGEQINVAERPSDFKSCPVFSICFSDISVPQSSAALRSPIYCKDWPLPQPISSSFFPATSPKSRHCSSETNAPYKGSAVAPKISVPFVSQKLLFVLCIAFLSMSTEMARPTSPAPIMFVLTVLLSMPVLSPNINNMSLKLNTNTLRC